MQTYRAFEECRVEESIAKEKLEQAGEANTEEAKRHTNIGKIQTKIEQVATVLGYAPEPHLQLASIGLGKAAGALEIAQKIWIKGNQLVAEQRHNNAVTACKQAQSKVEETNIAILSFEKRVGEAEKEALAHESKQEEELANSLKLSPSWGDVEWQRWSHRVLGNEHDPLVTKVSSMSEVDAQKVNKLTAELWQQRQEEARQKVKHLSEESRRLIGKYQHAYDEATRNVQEQEAIVKQQEEALKSALKQKGDLQKIIEDFLEHQGEQLDAVKLEQERNDFCKNFNALIRTEIEMSNLEKNWEKSLEKLKEKKCAVFEASEPLAASKKLQQRLKERAEKIYKQDQALLRKYWPESDPTYRPYTTWKLPFSEEGAASLGDAEITGERASSGLFEKIVPRIPMEELEARGKRFYIEIMQRWGNFLKSETKPKEQEERGALTANALPEPSTKGERDTASFSSEESHFDPLEELSQWNEKQLLHRSEENEPHYKRWETFKNLQKTTQQKERLLRKLGQAKLEALEAAETGTVFSFATKRTDRTKSVLSFFSSAGGKQHHYTTAELEEEIQKLEERERRLLDQWGTLVDEAEKERAQRLGLTYELSDQLKGELWKAGDEMAVEELQNQERLQQEKEYAKALEERWNKNVARWEARTEADKAEKRVTLLTKELEEIKKNETNLLIKKTALEKKEKEIASALEQQEEHEKTWRNLLHQHTLFFPQDEDLHEHDTHEALEKRFKEFDQAVVHRWDRLQEKIRIEHGEEVEEPGKAFEALDSGMNADIDLSLFLEQEEKKMFGKKGISHAEKMESYKKSVLAKAFEMARYETPGAKDAWETQLRLRKKMIQESNSLHSEEREQFRILQEGLATLLQEQERLHRIETIWRSILESEYHNEIESTKKAAYAYHVGEQEAWHQLSSLAQERYQKKIEAQDHRYQQALLEEERQIDSHKTTIEKIEKKLAQFFGRIFVTEKDKQLLEASQKKHKIRSESLEKRKLLREVGRHCEEYMREALVYAIEGAKWLEEIETSRDQTATREEKGTIEVIALAAYEIIRELYPKIITLNQSAEQTSIADYEKAIQFYMASIETGNKELKFIKAGEKERAAYYTDLWGAQHTAAWTYGNAAKAEVAGKKEIAADYRKAGALREQAAATRKEVIRLVEAGEKELTTYYKALSDSQHNAGWAYGEAAKAEDEGKKEIAAEYRKAVVFYEQAAETYKEVIRLIETGGQERAAYYKELGNSQHQVGFYYGETAKAEDAGKKEISAEYRKAAAFYEQAVETRKEAIRLFERDENELASYYKDLGISQHNVDWCYHQAADAEDSGKKEIASEYRKAAVLSEQAVETIKEAIRLVKVGEREWAEYYKDLGIAQHQAGWAYAEAAKAEDAGRKEIAVESRKEALSSEQAAERKKEAIRVVEACEKKMAAYYKELGDSQHQAAWDYGKAAEADDEK